jgi:hypothetical protein
MQRCMQAHSIAKQEASAHLFVGDAASTVVSQRALRNPIVSADMQRMIEKNECLYVGHRKLGESNLNPQHSGEFAVTRGVRS